MATDGTLNASQSNHSIVGRTPVGIYAILDAKTNQQVFDYDTFVQLKVSAKTKVGTFPVENGAFVSYNKASAPYDLKVEIAVSDLADRRHQLIVDLDREKAGVRLFNITSADATYLNYTLEGYSLSFTRKGGWGIVVASLEFVEVREVSATYGKAKAGAGGTKSGGTVAAVNTSAWSTITAGDLAALKVLSPSGSNPTGASTLSSKTTKSPKAATTPASGPATAPTSTAPSVK